MDIPKSPRIVSIHGYNTSHNTGFEGSVYERFSPWSDFVLLDLPGHGRQQVTPRFMPLKDVIEEGVERVTQVTNRDTTLVGTSFGAYVVLEAVRRGANPAAIVLIKPMVDIKYTLAIPRPEMNALQDVLRPRQAARPYEYGTPENPYDLLVPGLVFTGKGDIDVGDKEFVEQRLRGREITHVVLDGAHKDTREGDVQKVLREMTSFLRDRK
ncbi:MAG: alpha/beta fold hydrolase [archaeon]|nr:alpha/beta fold hydrolase [archaeon]MCR4323694.1 alpha/beta fold hydrolase [Nanoarchaeota archaeon]